MRFWDWLRARLAGHVSAGPRGRVRIGPRAEWPSVEHFEAAERERHLARTVDVIAEDEAGACWRGRPFLVWTWEPLTPEPDAEEKARREHRRAAKERGTL